jgi:LysM repeat protein
MKKFYLFIFFLLCLFSEELTAQDSFVKHTVLKEETVLSIAQKYKVTPNDLYQLNPDLTNGIKENQVILIPIAAVSKPQQLPKKEATPVEKQKEEVIYYTVQAGETKFGLARRFNLSILQLEQQNPHIISGLQTDHKLEIRGGADVNPTQKVAQSSTAFSNINSFEIYTVLPNETLYGISKRHGITVSELENNNKDYLFGILKSGQSLRVPAQNKQVVAAKNGSYHLVVAGETKYGLSKQYGVSIEELERNNPQIVRMLQTGQQVVISGLKAESSVAQKEVILKVVEVKKEVVTEKVDEPKLETSIKSSKPSDWVAYEIKPKQTMYGILKMTGLTIEELIEKNPNLEVGVQSGMIIKIPADKITTELASVSKTPKTVETEKIEIKNTTVKSVVKLNSTTAPKGLLKTINKVETKEVALLLPFSMGKEDFDNKNSSGNFERSTDYDFYRGANLAIDSLKKMNVQLDVKTIEIPLNKDNKVDVSVLKKNKVENSKAILLFSSTANSEKISEFAAKENIPLIINQKIESSKMDVSTYVGVPSEEDLTQLMLKYIAGKNGNLIVVSDESNASKETFIQLYYPKARFINVSDKGIIEAEALQNELIHNRKNYVVLNTEKNGLILNTTTILLKESTTYDIQLALFKPKETITGEGLSDMRFKILKMVYPSFSKRTNQINVNQFKANFRKKFNMEPSEKVIQGFDLTFDALVRLFQDSDFETLAKDEMTEQLLYTFRYVENPEGGYSNQGGFILQYDVESDTKLAN